MGFFSGASATGVQFGNPGLDSRATILDRDHCSPRDRDYCQHRSAFRHMAFQHFARTWWTWPASWARPRTSSVQRSISTGSISRELGYVIGEGVAAARCLGSSENRIGRRQRGIAGSLVTNRTLLCMASQRPPNLLATRGQPPPWGLQMPFLRMKPSTQKLGEAQCVQGAQPRPLRYTPGS